MIKWLAFIFVPLLIICILEPLSGIILNPEMHGFYYNVIKFFVFFIGGVIIFKMAPNSSAPAAYILGAIYLGFMWYLAISTNGNVDEYFGQEVVQEFSWVEEIVKSAGLLLGIIGAVKNKQENESSN